MQSVVHRISFTSTLAVTMGAATFALVAFGVLAAELIDTFGVERWQVGALVTATALGGAVVSPSLGVLADRMGARRSTLVSLAVSGFSLACLALAPTFGFLVAAALLAGVAQASANPATNKLISLHVETGRRGVTTGIKQSGVQFGTFLGGLFLPLLALRWEWRGAVLAFVALPVAWLVLSWATVPPDPQEDGPAGRMRGREIPPFILRLALYGFLLGAGGTTIFTYLPLYGQEALGLSQRVMGTAVALTGLVGIVARIAWGRVAEVRLGSVRSLVIIAGLATCAALLLLAAPTFGSPLIWVAAVVTGASASAWNTVGMLAVIQGLPARLAGKGSGIVLFGFLGGLGVGAPTFGWSVDRLGGYGPGWAVVAVVFLLALLVIRRAEATAG